MLTLAIETASQLGSLALFRDRKLIESRQWSREGSHSEFLTSSFEDVLRAQQLDAKDLARVAVDIGPGSFTGLRVSANFARALGFSLNIPIFTINSLELLACMAAQNAPEIFTGDLIAVEYGFRDLAYLASFEVLPKTETDQHRRVRARRPPQAMTLQSIADFLSEALGPFALVGSGASRVMAIASTQVQSKRVSWPENRGFVLAEDFQFTLALDPKLDVGPDTQLTTWIHTIPLYIRASEAEEKLKLSALKHSHD